MRDSLYDWVYTMKKEVKKSAEHWGSYEADIQGNFYGAPFFQFYKYHCLTGNLPAEELEYDWLYPWLIRDYLGINKADNCLSLCCGFGQYERLLAKNDLIGHMTGLDVSEGALVIAREKAAEEGFAQLDYRYADLNKVELPESTYDLILANGALHHITNLEGLLGQIKRALKPGGYLIANELVTQDYMQHPFRQREIINAVIHLLPHELRDRFESTFVPNEFKYPFYKRAIYMSYQLLFNASDDIPPYLPKKRINNNQKKLFGWYSKLYGLIPRLKRRSFKFGKVWDTNDRFYKYVDPSECVRSSMIVPTVKRIFESVELKPYNGSVLLAALDDKFYAEIGNYPYKEQIVEMLINIEKTMVLSGEIQSDSVIIIAKK